AATGLLRHIDARRGVVDESLEKAATLLAQRTDVGQLLIQAMTQSSDGARTASVQHRLARLAAGAAATPQEARAVLTGAVRTSGVDVATIATLLDTYPSGEASAKLSALTSIVAEQPLGADAAAEALLETGRDVAATLAVARDASNIESRMVAAATLRRLGRVRDAKTVLADVNLSQASRDMALGVVASRAANAGAAGDPVTARELAATITGDSAIAARTKALCEIAAGSAAGARAALDPLIRGELAGASVDDYLLAADLALRENASGEVPALLAKARELDASDERVHEAFAALYSPQGAMPNEQLLGEAMREMRAAIPGSQLLRLLIAQDQAQRGLWRQAMPNLQALVNERGRPAEALDSLVRVWERNADDATLAEAERLLQARLANRPESTPWMLAYSRVLMRNKKTAEADNLLAAGIESLQSEMLMRQREFVLREGLKQPEAADALMQQRLALAPPTLANKLELATIAARQGRGLDALRELAEAAPLAGTMQLPQARNVVALVSNVKPEELRELSQHESEGIVQFMEAARKLQRFAPASELARAQLLAQARPGNSAELLALCKELQPVSEQIATFAIVRIVETLRARPDHSPLIRFLGTFALDAETPDPGLVNEWLVRTAVRGNLDDARFLIDNVRDLELANTIVAQYSDAELPNELPRAKAEVAYVLSNLATSVMRDAMSNTCLELCLSLYPKHPWAANNLAYQMLEHGGDMQRIESLVEVAYSQLSDEASVIDTKGWLRYKQGQLDDVQLADGTVREGAITLIERAVTMVEARGDDNAELYDHLGDALWQRDRAAQGGEPADRARAVELWRKAIKSLDEELVMRRNIELPGLPRVAEIKAHRNRVESKRLAAETSGQPAVSPMSVPPTLTPRPEPAPIDIDAIWNLNRQRQLQE
ncbi:MAG TPA: hypothetical protein VK157_16920, partial [Phycisphaerales bacterium]|nr:hypothetical protein [Phycisphaerales bacterium]